MGDSCSRGVRPLSQKGVTLIKVITKARKRHPFKREASEKGVKGRSELGPRTETGKFPHWAGTEAAGKAFEFQAGAKVCPSSWYIGSAGEGRNAATH